MQIVTGTSLPEHTSADNIYHLTPIAHDAKYYSERTDRNIGVISQEEQNILQRATVAIAGCGGMGSLTSQILLRAGIGTLKIADGEAFDTSNINRQYGATQKTIGLSKAIATARMLRDVTDDTTLWVYPQGFTPETADHFLQGCDVLLDEIEFWAVGSRILLHQKARQAGVPIITSTCVGFGSLLFLFEPNGVKVEDLLGMTLEEAMALEKKNHANALTTDEKLRVMSAVIGALIPQAGSYAPMGSACGNPAASLKRLKNEGKAPVFASAPPVSCGFLASHALMYLLRNSGIKRTTPPLPHAPGYLFFDSLHMRAIRQEPGIWMNMMRKLKSQLLMRVARKHL